MPCGDIVTVPSWLTCMSPTNNRRICFMSTISPLGALCPSLCFVIFTVTKSPAKALRKSLLSILMSPWCGVETYPLPLRVIARYPVRPMRVTLSSSMCSKFFRFSFWPLPVAVMFSVKRRANEGFSNVLFLLRAFLSIVGRLKFSRLI